MSRLDEAARSAADAIDRGDAAALAVSIDESYDLRAALGPLDPRHVALVRAARDLGLCANYAGSGGAIVGLCEDPERLAALQERLSATDACAIPVMTL